jgi:Na+/H+ antiporter NhaD/arsenite permease-like protein
MLNIIFQRKNLFFILLIVFFGLFIIVNGLKQIGLTEGMNGGSNDIVTGTNAQIAKVYNF